MSVPPGTLGPGGSALGAPVVAVPGGGTVDPVPEVPRPEPVPETSTWVVPVPLVAVPPGGGITPPEVPPVPERPGAGALVPEGRAFGALVFPGDEPGTPDVGPGTVPVPNGLAVVEPVPRLGKGGGTTEPPPTPVLGAAEPAVPIPVSI